MTGVSHPGPLNMTHDTSCKKTLRRPDHVVSTLRLFMISESTLACLQSQFPAWNQLYYQITSINFPTVSALGFPAWDEWSRISNTLQNVIFGDTSQPLKSSKIVPDKMEYEIDHQVKHTFLIGWVVFFLYHNSTQKFGFLTYIQFKEYIVPLDIK